MVIGWSLYLSSDHFVTTFCGLNFAVFLQCLPHIDMLVDSTIGHVMLSFMDGFFGYNQILTAEDREKTSFITKWGTYCYRAMPFGLKNAGATYQRAAIALFLDMLDRGVEVYVDDMVVKSHDKADHWIALERSF